MPVYCQDVPSTMSWLVVGSKPGRHWPLSCFGWTNPLAGLNTLRQLCARLTNLFWLVVSPSRPANAPIAKSEAAYSSVVATEP